MTPTVLVVDDEKEIADLVEVYLQNEGFTVCKAYTGKDAAAYIEQQPFDLAILDVMLPDIDGFSLCRKIRDGQNYPVIMLTAKGEEVDKITGLTLGADDYVTKPFRPLELVARVKAQLRRYIRYNPSTAPQTSENDLLVVGGLVIDKRTHTVTLDEKQIALTPLEFSLLCYLCENQGRVVGSEELFHGVWGEKYYTGNNTVMVHIRHLREKMHDSAERPKYIKTVWGVGYTIEAKG